VILDIAPIPRLPLSDAIEVLAELDAIPDMPAEVDIFRDRNGASHIADAVQAFTEWVEDRAELEKDIRRALAYVLNLDDEALVAVTSSMHLRMRARASDRRRFLEMLWEATFASWKVKDFDPTEYELA